MANTETIKTPRISVLMPVYKTPEKYLREAIESILNQTFRDFEFLILDDCPEQSVEQIIHSYDDSRIKYIKNPSNCGISASRNRLISLAQGEYLAVMDHDDIALPKRFEKEVMFLDNNPDVGIVGTWYERFPQKKSKKMYIIDSQIKRDLMYNCSILHPSAMIRKSVLLENNICYEENYSPAEDYLLFIRLIDKTNFANIPEVLMKYRVHQNNTSKIQEKKMKLSAQKIHDIIIKQYPEQEKASRIKQKYKIFGLPVIKCKQKGLICDYTLFGLIKFSLKEKIQTLDATKLPIYIINFNRLSYLKKSIAMFEKYNLRNIHIIDNVSTYPPMVEYLKHTPYTVHYMPENYGHMVFFIADEFKSVRENEYYALTDPDVIAVENCPADFMDYFYRLLQQFPKFNKVGFSLKTDDVNGSAEAKELLQKWEKQFYKKRLNFFKPYLYDSALDTTFALYRPKKDRKNKDFYKAVRTGFPYEARHLPWYKDLNNLDDEDKFYNRYDCGSGNWNSLYGLKRIRECLISKCVDNWWEYLFSVKKSDWRTIIRIFGIKITFNKELPGD